MKDSSKSVYREAQVCPKDVDVVEVHDCFAPNEMLMYEALGLCPEGDGARFLRNGQWQKSSDGQNVLYKYVFKNLSV